MKVKDLLNLCSGFKDIFFIYTRDSYCQRKMEYKFKFDEYDVHDFWFDDKGLTIDLDDYSQEVNDVTAYQIIKKSRYFNCVKVLGECHDLTFTNTLDYNTNKVALDCKVHHFNVSAQNELSIHIDDKHLKPNESAQSKVELLNQQIKTLQAELNTIQSESMQDEKRQSKKIESHPFDKKLIKFQRCEQYGYIHCLKCIEDDNVYYFIGNIFSVDGDEVYYNKLTTFEDSFVLSKKHDTITLLTTDDEGNSMKNNINYLNNASLIKMFTEFNDYDDIDTEDFIKEYNEYKKNL